MSDVTEDYNNEFKGYIYFLKTITYPDFRKIGSTKYPRNRYQNFSTLFINKKDYEFERIYQIKSGNLNCYEIDEYLKTNDELNHYYNDSGEEWYKYSEDIFDNFEIILRQLNIEFEIKDIKELIPKNYEKLSRREILGSELKEEEKNEEAKETLRRKINQKIVKFDKRDYQIRIIKLGIEILTILSKFYLELATGAGKSFIVFNILKHFAPDIIFCLSPRLKINEQNIKADYLALLGDMYEPFNLSKDKNIGKFMKKKCKKIIVGCMNSYKNLVQIIKNNNENSLLWLDESHWGIESWLNTPLNEEQEYLLNSVNIKYRIFTSASPNTEVVENNERIFGKLYKDITVKELIKSNYLCPLKPFIFETDHEDVNYSQTILNDFKKYNRKWGLSFHNKCINGFNMFYEHFKSFIEGITEIKPFLLIGENLKDIEEIKKEKIINLNFNYKSFDIFEATRNSIAYVVKRCDMGYDFSKIDYISLTDKKLSYSDLIQCIGRGLRSDNLGLNGINLNKELYLMVPTYLELDKLDNYENIVTILQYLLHDIGISWNNIEFKDFKKIGLGKKTSKEKDYVGEEVIKSILADILKLKKINWNAKKLITFCLNNNIHCNNEYYTYKETNDKLLLPDVLPIDFNWCDTYRKHNYYDKIDCINKIKEIMESNTDLEYMEDHEEILEILNNFDTKIPNVCLWSFYGGSQSEYLVFN